LAFVVIDMQNSFASKGGMFDLADFDISGAAAVIDVNRRLLDAARNAGVQVRPHFPNSRFCFYSLLVLYQTPP
jgi:nicotinamidase-related amidase